MNTFNHTENSHKCFEEQCQQFRQFVALSYKSHRLDITFKTSFED